MTKYRKKPVVIEATQWVKNGDHPEDYTQDIYDTPNTTYSAEYRKKYNWEGDVVRYYRDPYDPGTGSCQHCGFVMHFHGWIDTLEGGHIVCPGDWIITGVQGEYYPCKPDIFALTYERVEDGAIPTPEEGSGTTQ
jgi:hypothetical protein